MPRSTAVAAVLAACVLAAAGHASAATTLTWSATETGTPGGRVIGFDGLTSGYRNGNDPLPGLTAKLTLTLRSVSQNSWLFDYTLANTSGGAVTGSRVSVFGFDVNPNVSSAAVAGAFDQVGNGNAPMLGRREVCFSAKANGKPNCSGGGSGGVALGQSGTGSFTLTFAQSRNSVELDNLFVRYQSLAYQVGTARAVSGASGVGEADSVTLMGGPGGAVPEPSTWFMMIGGLGLVGGALRRRARLAAT